LRASAIGEPYAQKQYLPRAAGYDHGSSVTSLQQKRVAAICTFKQSKKPAQAIRRQQTRAINKHQGVMHAEAESVLLTQAND
jgi:hypothetical protein